MQQFNPEQITFFAKTDARGQEVPFGIKAKDRTRHVYVIGKTGMGKSTLLENMAVQDIKNGNGLAFIDPHGQTAETLLDYIPEERMDDVLYFAPFDTDYPISFNVMEDVGPERRHLVVSGLMSVFKKVFVDQWSARMEYILSNTLLALLEYPDSTLLGVNRMLSDAGYRWEVIQNVTDPAVKSFWVDEFLNYNERYMQEAGDAIKNKIGQFTANPLIRNIIGQPKSSFDIRKIMDEKKIMIMNLSKGLVGETNANLLGSMLTTRIYLAAMSRANLTPKEMEEMSNFYFYVDEFQSFANATFSDILSEARKYKLNLTIAHQYIEQMEEEVRNAVFGNVGTTISFRVGPFDAEVLESVFTPKFLAPDIVNLGFAQIYLTLMIDGIGSQPFSAVTLPPIETSEVTQRDKVVAASRRKFGHPKAGVEAVINAWHEQEFEAPKKKGKANKGFQNNKGGNGNNRPPGNFNKKFDNNSGSSQRPEQKNEKSPEDLKAVLRTMATPDLNKEVEKKEAVSGNESEAKKVEAPQQKPAPTKPEKTDYNDKKKTYTSVNKRTDYKHSSQRPEIKRPEIKNEKSPEDLKAVLRSVATPDQDKETGEKKEEVLKKEVVRNKYEAPLQKPVSDNPGGKNGKSAEDLREVLRGMAASSQKKEVGNNKEEVPRERENAVRSKPTYNKPNDGEASKEAVSVREQLKSQERLLRNSQSERVEKQVESNPQKQTRQSVRPEFKNQGGQKNGRSNQDNSALKNALAAAIKNQEAQTSSVRASDSKEVQKQAEVIKPTRVVNTEQSKPSEVTNGMQFTPKSVANPAPVAGNDPLAPKKLERMMRITGNDKTPLG